MKITVPKDCDNAPRRRMIRDLNIAFAYADSKEMAEFFHPDIVWEMVGNKTLNGIAKVLAFLGTATFSKANALNLEVIITHGKFASAMGSMRFAKETIAFNDTYEFTSAASSKLKKITSFAIPIK